MLTNDERTEDECVADPCIHERDWVRLEQKVERHDDELRNLQTIGAGTQVYMKQILDTQEEVKTSIREIQTELQNRPNQRKEDVSSWSDVARKVTPDVIKLVLILAVIIAVLVGADNLLTKTLAGGTP